MLPEVLWFFLLLTGQIPSPRLTFFQSIRFWSDPVPWFFLPDDPESVPFDSDYLPEVLYISLFLSEYFSVLLNQRFFSDNLQYCFPAGLSEPLHSYIPAPVFYLWWIKYFSPLNTPPAYFPFPAVLPEFPSVLTPKIHPHKIQADFFSWHTLFPCRTFLLFPYNFVLSVPDLPSVYWAVWFFLPYSYTLLFLSLFCPGTFLTVLYV